MYTKTVEKKVEDRLLATHISANANFEKACMSGDGIANSWMRMVILNMMMKR